MKAIVPIKKNSNRVPGKNFRSFHGMPLYHVIIKTLAECPHIDEIIVDTDSPDMIEVPDKIEKRVKVLERPESLTGDDISVNLLIQNDIDVIEGEHFLQTHCTNPLLGSNTISDAIDYYMENLDEYDSLISVTRLQTRLYNHSFKPINHNPGELIKTQDLKPVFEENSNFYIFSRKSFVENSFNRVGKKPGFFEVNRLEAVDIDTEEEFLMTEALWSRVR